MNNLLVSMLIDAQQGKMFIYILSLADSTPSAWNALSIVKVF